VAGKTEGVLVYEPLCRAEAATEEHRRLAEHTKQVWESFQAAGFTDCVEAITEMETAVGTTKLTALYREMCDANIASPPDCFDGQVVLTHK
jgi:hypothetical protein